MTKKWALILGASSGMGLATSKKLANHGFNLILIHRDRRSSIEKIEQQFGELRKKVELMTFNEDALNAESRDRMLDAITEHLDKQSIQLLLHSVAKGNLKRLAHKEIARSKPASMLEEKFEALDQDKKAINFGTNRLEELDFTLTNQAMATSLLSWTNSILDRNLFASTARVIGITSEGDQKVWPGYGAVAVAKSSLETLSKYMAVEFAPHGLRVNLVHAGVTVTPSLDMIPGSDLMKVSGKYRNPFGRLTTPEDVANVIYLLCQPEADWINGTRIMVDGGEHLV